MIQPKPTKPQQLLTLIYLAILGLTITLLALDTLIYPGFIAKRIIIKPNWLIALVLGLFLVLKKQLKLPAWFNQASLASYLLTFLAYLGMVIAENLIFTNVVFNYLHLHPDQFFFFLILFLGLSVVSLSSKQLKQHYRLIIFTTPLLLLSFGSALRLRAKPFFFRLLWEDGPVEYLTFFFSFIAGILSLLTAFKAKIENPQKIKQKWQLILFKVCFFVFGLGLIFVAGEEISWGQRIFNIKTPEEIEQVNLQKELNLHNHPAIFKYVYYGYAVIGYYCAFAWLILAIAKKVTSQKKLISYLELFTPPKHTMFWFLLMPFYVKLRYTYGIWSWTEFSESGEMYLMAGLMIWTGELLAQLKITKTTGKTTDAKNSAH